MIGTKVRGFRHLIRMAKASPKVKFFFKYEAFRVGLAEAVYVKSNGENPYTHSTDDYVMIFNNVMSNVKFVGCPDAETDKMVRSIREKNIHLWVVSVNKRDFQHDALVFSQMVAVPDDFEQKYKEFCDANKKQMPNATRYVEDANNPILKYLFSITNGSKNFFFWAVNLFFKQNVNLCMLERVMVWNDNYNQLSKKLRKGTITGYTSFREFFILIKELIALRRDKRANDVINMFNTVQKKALKSIELTERDYDTLSKFGKLSGKKKNNFIRKMSTIEDPSEILKQMSFLADIHFEWNKDSLLGYIKNSDGFKCDVVIDRGDMVLLKVYDYETVKRLAKTTNWCISKDKKYWNEYVENNPSATQYVLMDFSRKEDDNLSIVGFTSVHDRGITNAHDFQNKNLMQGGKKTMMAPEIKSFVPKFMDCKNIFGILDVYGIKMSDVVTYEPNQYKWDRESMFNYLNQCIDKDDYYIIYDDGDRVVIMAKNENIKYFFGDSFIDQHLCGLSPENQYIIFADFTMEENNPEKLIFGIITNNSCEHESDCQRLYNDRVEPICKSFDSKLAEYGLPYDIICRRDNPVDRFFNAIMSYDINEAKKLINDESVRHEIKSLNRSSDINDIIMNVTFAYNSADYINLFYDNGYKLANIIGETRAGDIARRMINNMFSIAANAGEHAYVPSQEDIKSFYDGKITEYNKALYIGNFLMLMKMLDKETNLSFLCRVVSRVHEIGVVQDLFDLIMTRVLDIINIEKDYGVSKYIAAYAFMHKSDKVINAILSKPRIDNRLSKYTSLIKKESITTTEMWVRNIDGTYVIENVNEEAIAHAPRRR